MSNPLESAVKKQICDFLNTLPDQDIMFWINESVGIYDPRRKIFLKKRSRYQRKGVADLLGIYRGKPFACEIKRPGSYHVSPEQKAFIEEFNRKGGIAFIAKSIEDVKKGLGIE